MQLIGKVLRHEDTVVLRNPDTSTTQFTCHVAETVTCIGLSKIEETCTWDTNLQLYRSAEPPKTLAARYPEELQVLLAAHDPELIARLRAAIHLALVCPAATLQPCPSRCKFAQNHRLEIHESGVLPNALKQANPGRLACAKRRKADALPRTRPFHS